METCVEIDPQLRSDLKTLALFIALYCRHRHPNAPGQPAVLKTHEVAAITSQNIELCSQCQKLLAHAFVKRSHCPMNPKPACKHCPNHCYHPVYRVQIREVMKVSGTKMMLGGRLDYLFHLLF